jgi:Amt family ammonium transporter
MPPAVGLLYGGFSRTEHALSGVLVCCIGSAVVTIQWLVWGYSLAFSDTSASSFIGNLDFAGLRGIGWEGWHSTTPAIPISAFCVYQLQCAALTVALIFGSALERSAGFLFVCCIARDTPTFFLFYFII